MSVFSQDQSGLRAGEHWGPSGAAYLEGLCLWAQPLGTKLHHRIRTEGIPDFVLTHSKKPQGRVGLQLRGWNQNGLMPRVYAAERKQAIRVGPRADGRERVTFTLRNRITSSNVIICKINVIEKPDVKRFKKPHRKKIRTIKWSQTHGLPNFSLYSNMSNIPTRRTRTVILISLCLYLRIYLGKWQIIYFNLQSID